jgi:hypothetical protein
MAIDCLIATLTHKSTEGASECVSGSVVQLGVLQSDYVSALAGYEQFSDERALCMPIEGTRSLTHSLTHSLTQVLTGSPTHSVSHDLLLTSLVHVCVYVCMYVYVCACVFT